MGRCIRALHARTCREALRAGNAVTVLRTLVPQARAIFGILAQHQVAAAAQPDEEPGQWAPLSYIKPHMLAVHSACCFRPVAVLQPDRCLPLSLAALSCVCMGAAGCHYAQGCFLDLGILRCGHERPCIDICACMLGAQA